MENEITPHQNGWNEYKKLVLKQLEGLIIKTEDIQTRMDEMKEKIEARIDTKTQTLLDKIDRVDKRVVILETKAILYGALAGLVVTIVIQFVANTIFK